MLESSEPALVTIFCPSTFWSISAGQRNHFLFVVMLGLFVLAEYFLDEAALQCKVTKHGGSFPFQIVSS
jgi:hypothetical protein